MEILIKHGPKLSDVVLCGSEGLIPGQVLRITVFSGKDSVSWRVSRLGDEHIIIKEN